MIRGTAMTVGLVLAALAAPPILLSWPANIPAGGPLDSQDDACLASRAGTTPGAFLAPPDPWPRATWWRRPVGVKCCLPADSPGLGGTVLSLAGLSCLPAPLPPESRHYDLLTLHCLLTV